MMKTFLLALLVAMLLMSGNALAQSAEPDFFGPFEAENLRGEELVTDEVFANAEITLVNIWATWCPPCVAEMPHLAQIYEATEGTVQVVSVLTDSYNGANRDEKAIETMNMLFDKIEADFAVLAVEPEADGFLRTYTRTVAAIPKTVVVDSEGKVLGTYVGSTDLEGWLSIIEEVKAQIHAEA